MHPDSEKPLLDLMGRKYSLFRGIKLQYKRYRSPTDEWDHDHCHFCWAKFYEAAGPEFLHYGYATCEDYYWGLEYEWICDECFSKYRGLFAWRVIGDSPQRLRRLYETGKRVSPLPRTFRKPEGGCVPKPIRS